LVKSLTEEQRKKAIILKEAPKDILNDPKRADPTKPEGLPQAEMNPDQSGLLVRLIKEYIGRHRPDLAEEDWKKIEKNGLSKIHFAWAGGLERGEPHYYRVQGGSFVLEYDNVQNGANHAHSVVRHCDHDFGTDLLGEHYKAAHAK